MSYMIFYFFIFTLFLINNKFNFPLDTSYVLANYKTEPCKRPPRLCRQGYACPQYHNSRDKRRNPRKIKYRYVNFIIFKLTFFLLITFLFITKFSIIKFIINKLIITWNQKFISN